MKIKPNWAAVFCEEVERLHRVHQPGDNIRKKYFLYGLIQGAYSLKAVTLEQSNELHKLIDSGLFNPPDYLVRLMEKMFPEIQGEYSNLRFTFKNRRAEK